MKKHCVCIGLLGVFIAAAPPLAAHRSHNADLFVRVSVGPGLARSSIDSSDRSKVFELAGPSVDYNVALGAVMFPSWVLHFTMFGWYAPSPDAEFATTEPNAGTTMYQTGWGVGLTYFVMPLNVYFTVTPAFSSLRTEAPEVGNVTNERGWAVEGALGKEWWLNDTRALGLAVAGNYHSNPSPDITDHNWTGYNVALRLSLSFN